jgi:hypothetical protein
LLETNGEELPVIPTKWTSYAELVLVLLEMVIQHMIFQIEYIRPNDQCFTTKIKDTLIASALSGSFGMLAALLMPYVDYRICGVTQAMDSLGEMKIKQKGKGVHSVQFAGTKPGKGG